jgi:hypothetical protein
MMSCSWASRTVSPVPGEQPLILQLLDDRLLCRGQPFAGHRPTGRETVLAQRDKARQQPLQDRSAISREQRLGGLGPPDDRALDPADPLVVGIGERDPVLLHYQVVHLTQREGHERQRVHGLSAASPYRVVDEAADQARLEGQVSAPGGPLDHRGQL